MATGTTSLRYVAAPADLPRGTLTALFFRTIERFGKADALRWRDGGGAWHSISHARILEDVRRAALGLESLGVRRGDRVALLSENRPEWALADYAALCIGALDVPIYATLPAHQAAFVLRDSGARAIFVSTPEQLAKVREVWAELPGLERAIVFDDAPTDGERVLTWRELLERGRAAEAAG
ncbi:MAG: AMP-binding protein, partial [Gemmatimonadetes bacterium]|nr:AMP-binding protein [Gemmatimonadota bacterium]